MLGPWHAIHATQQNGHRAYFCTGRSKAEMHQNILNLNLDGMIGGNGAYIEDHGTVVFHGLIPAEVEHRLVDWLNDRGLCFYLESNNSLFASGTFETASPTRSSTSGLYKKGKSARQMVPPREKEPFVGHV